MIIINKTVKKITLNEYWFLDRKLKHHFFSVVSYRSYLGSNKPKYMFQEVSYTLLTDLTLPEEKIFSSVKSNFRNEIRKAEKSNFIYEVNNISKEDFIDFYNSFAQTKRLNLITVRMLEQYELENLIFFTAYDTNLELLVAHAFLVDGKYARLLHSASQIHRMEYSERRKIIGFINKKLHWESIVYFKNKAYQYYDWGGFAKNTENTSLQGINAFKRSFGGSETKVYNYNSILFEIIRIFSKFVKH
jgi:hypothetical protein